jgi:hypothetical protein
MSKISVIIPTYNRARLLPEALKAVLSQSRPIDQIIVVDDGSSDDTEAVVKNLSPDILYIYQENSGKSAALNRGLESCTGDYIWICDDDDISERDAAKMLADALDRNPEAGYAFGKYNRFAEDPATGKHHIFGCGYWPNLTETSIAVALLEDFFIFQNATFVRKAAYDAVGPFRTDLVRSQDYEMITRLAIAYHGVYVPEFMFRQREHQGERGSSKDRFSVSQQFAKWMQYDADIFRAILPNIPMDLLVPPTLHGTVIANRAAILQRATIYARRKIWVCAFEDLRTAVRMSPAPLTAAEAQICGRFLLSKYGCDEVASERWITHELRILREQGETGRSIASLVSRGLLWRIKEAVQLGRRSTAFGFVRAYLEINGPVGIISELRRRLRPPVARTGAGRDRD